jgi:putative redox protein
MVTTEVIYDGKTRCTLTHQSGATMQTVAPKDIGGDGDSFSPTDMVAAALAACILTTVAMWAERHGLNLDGAKAKVTKEMRTEPPRRIARLATTITIPAGRLTAEMRPQAEQIAHACPVHKSLHPEVDAPVTFEYED